MPRSTKDAAFFGSSRMASLKSARAASALAFAAHTRPRRVGRASPDLRDLLGVEIDGLIERDDLTRPDPTIDVVRFQPEPVAIDLLHFVDAEHRSVVDDLASNSQRDLVFGNDVRPDNWHMRLLCDPVPRPENPAIRTATTRRRNRIEHPHP